MNYQIHQSFLLPKSVLYGITALANLIGKILMKYKQIVMVCISLYNGKFGRAFNAGM